MNAHCAETSWQHSQGTVPETHQHHCTLLEEYVIHARVASRRDDALPLPRHRAHWTRHDVGHSPQGLRQDKLAEHTVHVGKCGLRRMLFKTTCHKADLLW